MIELSHVTKTFGGATRALDDLTLTVPQGASITTATPSYTVPTGLTAKYGQTLANITLPKQLRLRVVTN